MALPRVAIIGRPNVGKSSLLNALAGEMISIVEPTPGVTRDRVSTLIENNDRYIELVDTGGYGIVDSEQLSDHIQQQIDSAIKTADLVIFMVDIREGIVSLDEQIAKMLRKSGADVIGVANKADSAELFPQAAEFSKFGFGDFICISAANNLNKSELMDKVFDTVDHSKSDKLPESETKIAVVGKRNTGKSTLLNSLVGSERVIASEVPGTTRDSVDVRFEKAGMAFTIIDTAGFRKKRKIADSIEFYSYSRAKRAISRSEVIFLMIDATLPISNVDKKLSKIITTEYKACIITINKWDLAEDKATEDEFAEYITAELPGLRYAPVAFTTATEGRNVENLLGLAAELKEQATMHISTPKLNNAIEAIKQKTPTSKKATKGRPKIYYATQVAVNPVTILMFVNNPKLFEKNYLKHTKTQLQEMLDIEEVPMRLLLRARRKQSQ
jgi:GTP-binding protein